MKLFVIICVALFVLSVKGNCQTHGEIYFFGDTITFLKPILKDSFPTAKFTEPKVIALYKNHNLSNYSSIVDVIDAYKKKYILDDWLYYQLIRRTAETLCTPSTG